MTAQITDISDIQILQILIQAETKISKLKARVEVLSKSIIQLEERNEKLIEDKSQLLVQKEKHILEILKKTVELDEVKLLCDHYKDLATCNSAKADRFAENSSVMTKAITELLETNQFLESRVADLSMKLFKSHENSLTGQMDLLLKKVVYFYQTRGTFGKAVMITAGVTGGVCVCSGICYGIYEGVKAGIAAGKKVGGETGGAIGGLVGGAVGGMLVAAKAI